MNNELYPKVKELYNKDFSTLAIALKLGISRRTAQKYIKYIKDGIEDVSNNIDTSSVSINYLWQQPEDKKPEKRIVGVIGDLHQPFTKDGYLEFLIKTFEQWNVTDIVFVGDILDMHTLSRHPIEPDAMGVPDEFELAKNNLTKYYQTFPVAKVCIGNHENRLAQKASDSGIPLFCIKSLKELFDMPDGWDLSDKHSLYGVTYIHGTQFNSRNVLTTIANYTESSLVMGHQHSLLGVVYNTNLFEKESFAMDVGCGVDDSKYAFRYAKNNKMKSILGCGVVISDREAYSIPWR